MTTAAKAAANAANAQLATGPRTEEGKARSSQNARKHGLTARAERAYYRAVNELRALQTNRALRAIKLGPGEEQLAPQLVSVNDLTKRSHAEVTAEALKMAMNMVNYETGVYRLRSLRGTERQNEPTAVAAAGI